MLTNLLVTIAITLVTNQTETITAWEKQVPVYGTWNLTVNGPGPVMEQWGPMHKTITLECIKTTTASADYLGKPKVLWTEQESLWRTNVYYRCERIEKWTAWQTNDGRVYLTNVMTVTDGVYTNKFWPLIYGK